MTEYQKAYFNWVETRAAIDEAMESHFFPRGVLEARLAAWNEYTSIRDKILNAYKAEPKPSIVE